MLVRWLPVEIKGVQIPIDEVEEGKYEISLAKKMKKKLKKIVRQFEKGVQPVIELPGEERVIYKVPQGSNLFYLIEDYKEGCAY